jgi:hypothetical protein
VRCCGVRTIDDVRCKSVGVWVRVIAWREPNLFVVDCQGVEILTGAGVSVVELPELGEHARAMNAHLGT